jgi:hypothetical protein
MIGLTILGSVITGKVPALSKNQVMKAFRREMHCLALVSALDRCFIFTIWSRYCSTEELRESQLFRSVALKAKFPISAGKSNSGRY